jgi:hypothetical protein
MPTQAGFRSRLLKAVGVKHVRFFPLSQVLLAFSPSTIFSTSPNLPLIVIIYTTLLNYTPVISPYPTYFTCLRTSEPADKWDGTCVNAQYVKLVGSLTLEKLIPQYEIFSCSLIS